MVLQPDRRQPALLLIGPQCSGKTTFRLAMGLLLPPLAVVQYPDEVRLLHWQTLDDRTTAWEERLGQAWLAVTQDEPARYVKLFRHPERRDGRYLKWCLTHTHNVDPLPNVQRFDVGLLATMAGGRRNSTLAASTFASGMSGHTVKQRILNRPHTEFSHFWPV